jgi:hypothetical protein
MRPILPLFLSLTLFAPVGLPDSKSEFKDLQNHPFSVDFPAGCNLRMHLRSGEFHIIGRKDNKISVRLEGRNANKAQNLTVRFKRFDYDGELRVFGGPKSELQVIVEIPKASSLFVRMPAGDLTIDGVVGNKDVQLHAGDLTIFVGNPADYARVDASVYTGGLEAPPFGESHGGLFRSFEKHGPGQYKLHAHVGAGDLTLR